MFVSHNGSQTPVHCERKKFDDSVDGMSQGRN